MQNYLKLINLEIHQKMKTVSFIIVKTHFNSYNIISYTGVEFFFFFFWVDYAPQN